jgi:DUF1680 family protein
VRIVQDTRYPWDGAVKVTVTPDHPGDFTIKVRIPGWARNEPVPSDLYHFTDAVNDPVGLKVNGTPAALTLDKGYATLTRRWEAGDVIDLTLPMGVRRIVANDRVEADRDRVALQRGPIVYAAEWVDNTNGHVRNLVLPDTAVLRTEFRPDLLNGGQVVTAQAYGLARNAQGQAVKTEQKLVAIPYATWANRGRGEVYWFDDTGRGQVRVPKAWRVLYKDASEWKPVDASGEYGVAKDRYNTVAFTPVTTSGLRLEVIMQPQWSAGVQEWKVK